MTAPRIDPFDKYFKKSSDPFDKYFKGPPSGGSLPIDDEDGAGVEEEQPFFLKKAWDFGKFMADPKVIGPTMALLAAHRAPQKPINLKPFIDNASKTFDDIRDTFKNRTLSSWISDTAKETLEGVKSLGSTSGLNNFANGLIDFFAETPAEAISGQKNIKGEAIPMTPEEHTQAVQQTVANVANFMIQRGIAGSMLKQPTPLGAMRTTKLGALGKVAAANIAGGAASSAATEPLGQLGQEDYLSRVVSSTLASASVGAVLGTLFDRAEYNKKVAAGKVQFNVLQDELVNARAAASFLHNNPTKTPLEIVASVESVLASDDLVEAAVRAGLHGRGFYIPSLTPEAAANLVGKIAEAPAGRKGYSLPSKYKGKFRPTYKGTPIQWESEFDLISYIAQANGFKKHPALMADVMAKTGINKEQLIAHGKYVKKQLSEMSNSGLYTTMTQGDIEAQTQVWAEKGKAALDNARDGETLVDFNGRQWVKDGDRLVAGNDRIPINSTTNYVSFGRTGLTNSIPGKKIVLNTQEFSGNFNRNPDTINIEMGPNGDAYVSAEPLSKMAADVFRRTGFIPAQAVNLKGSFDQWFVDRLTNKHVDTLKKIYTLASSANPNDAAKLAEYKARLDELDKSPTKLTVRRYDKKLGWVEKVVPASDLSASFENKVTPSFEFQEGRKGIRVGALGEEAYFNEFVNRVVDDFETQVVAKAGKEGVEVPTFEDVYLRAAKDLGLREEVAVQFRSAIYDKIGNSLISSVLSEEDKIIYNGIRKAIDDIVVEEETDTAGFFRQLTNRNGYYAIDKGTGIELRDVETNDLVYNANNLRDGINFMARSGKAPLPVFDGAIPQDFFKFGNLSTDLKISDVGFSKGIDILNTNTHAIHFVPIRDLWNSTLNNIERLGLKTEIFDKIEGINDSLMRRRMFFAQNKPLMNLYKEAVTSADGLDAVDLDHVNRIMQTMSMKEIINGYLNRVMTPDEVATATKLSQELVKLNATTQEINNAYLAGVKAGKVGSVDFNTGVSQLLNAKQIKPELAKLVIDFGNKLAASSPDDFSPHAVLKLTNALQFPTTALSFADYARLHNVKPQAVETAVKLRKMFDEAAIVAGIPEARHINAYLPQMEQINAFDAYKNVKIPEEFARELNRVLSDRTDVVRNPLLLGYTYIQAVANEFAGSRKILNTLEKEIFDPERGVAKRLLDYDEAQSKVDPKISSSVGRTQAEYLTKLHERYKDAILGYPDISDKARKAMRAMTKHLFGLDLKGSFNSGSLAALVDSAYVGARPIQAVRDVLTSLGVTFQLFGTKFTKNVFTEAFSFSAKDIANLEDDLKIPRVIAQDFLAPDTDYASGAAMGFRSNALTKVQDIGMKLSLQHAVYVRTLAAVYKHTEALVKDNLGKAKRQEITLEQAVNNLNLDVHSPVVQRQFLAYARAGDINGAARLLGKWNGKLIANNYGEMQSPITWRKGVGRVAGQFGSWGANMMQTQLNALRSFGGPNWKKAAARFARLSAYTGALYFAGKESGLDLKNTMFTPIQAAPGLGPLVQLGLDMTEASQNVFSSDEGIRKKSSDTMMRYMVPGYPKWTEVGKWYIPGSYQMRDILRATEAWNDGNDPLNVLITGFGIQKVKE